MNSIIVKKPVHLLGIGNIRDIFRCINMGVDTFDCVYPTRLGRHGGALVKKEEKVVPKKISSQ